LKLLYGLQDKPLPPEVVKFAAKPGQGRYAGLFNVSACRNAIDRGRNESTCGETQELLDALGATPEKARIAAASPQIAAKRSNLSP
jgi:hypothetical protein